MTKERVIAAFDFDGTLTVRDSFVELAKHVRGRCGLLVASAWAAPWMIAWKLRLCGGGVAKQRLFGQLYGGMSAGRFREYCDSFAALLVRMEKCDVVERLRWHQTQGHAVYIVSASMPEWIAPWAALHGIDRDHILGTEMEVDGRGCITGRFATPNCSGAEKVRRLRMVEGLLDDATLYAYGDSSGDQDLLAIADYPAYVGKKRCIK